MVVVKQQPLGGVRAALDVVDAAGVPAVVDLDDGDVGRASPPGLALAAALPELPFACGLGTAASLPADVTRDPLVPVDGVLRGARGGARPGGRSAREPGARAATRTSPGSRGDTRARAPRARGCSRAERPRHLLGDRDVLGVERRRRTARTGTCSSPSRSQFDGCAPWPSARSWWVRRSTGVGAPAPSRPACSGGSDANSGCASQRSRNASTPSRSIPGRELLVGGRGAGAPPTGRRCRATRSRARGAPRARAGRARAAGTAARPSSTRRRSPCPPSSPSAAAVAHEVEAVGHVERRRSASTRRAATTT